MSAAAPPLWKHVLGEAVLGNRGLAKLNGLWFPLAVFQTARPPGPPRTATGAFFLIAGAVSGWILSAIIANDVADRTIDGVDRSRWVNRLPPAARIVLVVGLTLSAWTFPALAKAGPAAVWALIAASALGLAYSLRPFRLKERGLAGIFAYSLSCALAYALVPWAWLGAPGANLLFIAPAVFLDKWTNLHFHQVADLESDRRAATGTYAVRAGRDAARRALRYMAGLAGLAAAASGLHSLASLDRGWQALALGAVGAVSLAAGLSARRRRGSPGASPLIRELPPAYLALTYGVFRVYPLVLLARLARAGGIAWTAGAAAAALAVIEAASLLRSPGHLGRPTA